MTKVNITETVLRDAHQCLIATRMRTEDMLPICQKLDAVGYWALEVWGGATFDSCLRFLKEDPWERLRELKKALPNTRLMMLLRGQNLLGYRHYPDDIVTAFIERSAANGVDVFRIFDALNDLRNTELSIKVVKAQNKHAQGAISYTTSPVHDIPQFIKLAKRFEELGCDSIAIKDMAGLLTPSVAKELYQALTAEVSIPIHNHSHATSGVASICHWVAVENGCVHIDTALSPFAEGASHPCTESMIAALADTEYATELDLTLLQEIADYFREVRKRYHQFESDATGIDPRVQIYQVPGGMISNLHNQLKAQNALDKLSLVHEEIPRVRKDLGYPPLVTPTSQIVGTQAVMNVLSGERYKNITNEVKLYCQGKYGKAPGDINPDVIKKAIGQADRIDVRPADLLAPELDKLRKEIGSLAETEEDVLSYAMFPDVAKTYLQERRDGTLKPEPLEPPSTQAASKAPQKFHCDLHGERYTIEITGQGDAKQQRRPFYLTIDGVPEEVIVEALAVEGAQNASESQQQSRKAQPGDVCVSMPSTIVEVSVKVGDAVNAGDTILVAEAMKMETEVQAPIAGKVSEIHCQKGDSVTPSDVLVVITD